MFFRKITSKSSGKEYNYLKLIENYREGDKVKQRVVANLGSMEKLTPEKVNGLIAGLTRICGVTHLTGNLETKKILNYGDVLAVQRMWDMTGVEDALQMALAGNDHDFDVPLALKIMVMHQIIKPIMDYSLTDWRDNLYLPDDEVKQLSPFHFQRALDFVLDNKEKSEGYIFKKLDNYFQVNTDLAFCHLTSGTVEQDERDELNLTNYGKYILSETGGLQKVDFGLLVSRDGMPMGHCLLNHSLGENPFQDVLDYLKTTFDIHQCVFVGQRTVHHNPNLDLLVARGYKYIIGRNLISSQDYELLSGHLANKFDGFTRLEENLWYQEIQQDNLRYLLCYNPVVAAHMQEMLEERLAAVEKELQLVQKTKHTKSSLNRKVPVLKDSYCRKYFTWDLNENTGVFTFERKQDLVLKDVNLAGAFILETNDEFLRAQEILKAYMSLSTLDDSFRQIKNFAPTQSFLYAEHKVSANIFICVLSSMLEKVMEKMLRQAGLSLDAQHALHVLGEIKVVISELDGQNIKSVTSTHNVQDDIFNALGLFKEQRTVV